MSDLITTDLVRLDVDLGSDKLNVIRALADVVGSAGRATDTAQLVEDVLAREATSSTGLPGGIAIPHCRTRESRSRPSSSPDSARRSTSAPRTGRPTWRSSSPPRRAGTPPTSSS